MFQNNDSVRKQISNLLYSKFPDKKSKLQEQRQQLLLCMENSGYITERPPEQDFEEVEYQEIYGEPENEQEFMTSYDQQRNPELFNRTFIQETPGLKKYTAQTYTITQEEQEYNEIYSQIELAIGQLNKIDLPVKEIIQEAMRIYLGIKKVYRETTDFKGEMKGRIKRGYVLLSLYYALINYNVCIPKIDLVIHFDNTSLADLPKADKNIKMIFGFSDPNEKCLGGMRGLFDIPTINKINDTIKILKENGIFNDPVLLVQVAAAIYYVTKTNLGVIKEYTGISPDTIRKNVLIIKNFYKTI